jgi:hypothetical protein
VMVMLALMCKKCNQWGEQSRSRYMIQMGECQDS